MQFQWIIQIINHPNPAGFGFFLFRNKRIVLQFMQTRHPWVVVFQTIGLSFTQVATRTTQIRLFRITSFMYTPISIINTIIVPLAIIFFLSSAAGLASKAQKIWAFIKSANNNSHFKTYFSDGFGISNKQSLEIYNLKSFPNVIL